MKIHGEASFVGNGAKNQQLAQDRAAYIADLLNKENITTETSVGSLSETQQSQLSTFAQNLKMPVKRLIQEHNRGKKF